ncbi:unnamed protein product, partial [Notodromas monacha]
MALEWFRDGVPVGQVFPKNRWRVFENGTLLIRGYTVAYYSPGTPSERSTWTTVASRLRSHVAVISRLSPGRRYVFTARAENSAGFSAPSGLSKEVVAAEEDSSSSSSASNALGANRRVMERRKLESCVFRLVRIKPESPTAVRIFWEVEDKTVKTDGLYIRYRRVMPHPQNTFATDTLMTSDNS